MSRNSMMMVMIIIFVLIDQIIGIHFRGGTFSWAPVSKLSAAINNISIIQSYSWVRTYEFCDTAAINNQKLIGTNSTSLQCISGCVNSGSYCDCVTTNVICTDFSVTQDLSSGQKITFVSIAQNAQFYLTYQDSNWLALATAASATWSITSYVNLVVRTDNGLLNTPPVVSVLPVIHLPVSVQSVINLLAVDIDNDYIQCRWARLGGIDECGGVCQSVPGAQLLSNCSLILTPTVTQVYYAAAIMVEDFYSNTGTTTPLSSTPVQFLIHIYNSPTGCSTIPTIIGPYPDQSCLDVTVGVPYALTITAQIGCSGTTITDFVTVSPLGMIKSSSIITVSSTIYSVSFNWVPTSLQLGSNIFCVAAIGTYNVQSNQVCYKYIVSVTGTATFCPPIAVTNAAEETTTTPTDSGSGKYLQYIFLCIGLLVGFASAMIAMWAIHYFLNRQVCCLKPSNNYQKPSTPVYTSSFVNSRTAFP